jgi:flagellar hook-associated protein 1 FlgK
MSDLLTIGASGVAAFNRALTTTGDNIANSQTDGYARRTVQLNQMPGAGDVRFYRRNVRPGGVAMAGVQRSVNEWLNADARASASESGRTASRLNWVSAAERALDDGDAGVGTSATAMFNAADTLANDPTNDSLRQGFLQAVDDVATAFRRTADGLESVASGMGADAAASVSQLNTDLADLDRVNQALSKSLDGSTNRATLLDERDRLLDNISSSLAVTVAFDPRGLATVRMDGTSSDLLLSPTTLATVEVGQAANGALSFAVDGVAVVPMSGKLAGLSEAAAEVAGQRSALDTLAAQFASQLNGAHQSGVDANGDTGGALLALSGGAATLQAVALLPAQVAASSGGKSNGMLIDLASLRGAAGVEAGWSAQVAAHAQAVAAAKSQDSAATTRQQGAAAARAEVSGVDLDHEAAELIRFQQAYQAAASVVQVARDTVQSILDII